jgi:hypothetical protein
LGEGWERWEVVVAIGVLSMINNNLLRTMTKTRSLGLQLVAAIALATPITAFAQRGIPLKQGMGYAQARQLLLKSGWQTKATRWQDRYCPEFLGQKCKYPEVESCAPTGTGPCIFNWLNTNGKTLSVYTNSDRDGNTTIANWTLK